MPGGGKPRRGLSLRWAEILQRRQNEKKLRKYIPLTIGEQRVSRDRSCHNLSVAFQLAGNVVYTVGQDWEQKTWPGLEQGDAREEHKLASRYVVSVNGL
jgi:hypothetical protein